MKTRFTQRYRCALIVLISCLALVATAPASAQDLILRVNGENGSATTANPPPDGSAWGSSSFLYLQDALDAADDYLAVPQHEGHFVEIWVRGSDSGASWATYKPDHGVGFTVYDPSHSFELRTNVSIYGGFDGTETIVTDRRPRTFVATLSGDLNDDDVVTLNQDGTLTFTDYSDNSRHVVKAQQVQANPQNAPHIDGFTIRGGNAVPAEFDYAYGGGVLVLDSFALVRDCLIRESRSDYGGGGAAVICVVVFTDCSTGIFRNCLVGRNHTDIMGGGIFILGSGKIINTVVEENYATLGGGIGIYNGGEGDIVDTHIRKNTAAEDGGGVFIRYSSAQITNSLVHGNRAHAAAGLFASGANLINCTVANNEADYEVGGGIIAGNVTNCIFWGNTPSPQITGTVTYSIVEGGFVGTGNLDDDPLFVNPTAGNFRLQCGSPAIDVGNDTPVPFDEHDVNENGNDTTEYTPDLDLKERIWDGDGSGVATVDMGAYETTPTVNTCCPADIAPQGGDGQVNVDDLLVLLQNWGTCCPELAAPPCGDGVVNVDDLLIMLQNWGPCPTCVGGVAGSGGGGVPMPQSIDDCWDFCTAEAPDNQQKWIDCFLGCVQYLCDEEIIECQD